MSSCPGTVPQNPFPHPRPSLNKCPLILSGHLNLTYLDVKASFAGRLQIFAMVARKAVRRRSESRAIELPMPTLSANVRARSERVVHLRVSERFVAAFVPAN